MRNSICALMLAVACVPVVLLSSANPASPALAAGQAATVSAIITVQVSKGMKGTNTHGASAGQRTNTPKAATPACVSTPASGTSGRFARIANVCTV